jgi:hypothetical protein
VKPIQRRLTLPLGAWLKLKVIITAIGTSV